MLGEESHKATLDSSAGDNRIVCTVIYTARHREVSSTLKGLGSLANSPCLPYGNKIPIVPPRLLWGPHYLFSIQLKIIKSSSKHMPEGIGHFINKWRTKKMMCPIMLLNCKIHLCFFLAFPLPSLPNLESGVASHSVFWDHMGLGRYISPLHLLAEVLLIRASRTIFSLEENDSKVGRGSEKNAGTRRGGQHLKSHFANITVTLSYCTSHVCNGNHSVYQVSLPKAWQEVVSILKEPSTEAAIEAYELWSVLLLICSKP